MSLDFWRASVPAIMMLHGEKQEYEYEDAKKALALGGIPPLIRRGRDLSFGWKTLRMEDRESNVQVKTMSANSVTMKA